MPYVYTEQGIAMLSAVLKSEVAVDTSIKIMDTFVEMRKSEQQKKKSLSRAMNIFLQKTVENRGFQRFTRAKNLLTILIVQRAIS